jgi:hypothetical protein
MNTSAALWVIGKTVVDPSSLSSSAYEKLIIAQIKRTEKKLLKTFSLLSS